VLTSGDCIDENPFQRGRTIYYQSSGLARAPEGHVVLTGPSSINSLDLDSEDVETVLESEKFDYLLPKVAPDGSLFCIRVPYQGRVTYPWTARLVDIIMFPWRLAVAIFAFLNVFSTFFAKKPLTMAGGPNPGEIDISRRILHNRVVNVQETIRREGRKVAVSKDWKLVRFSNGRTMEVASNVLWFELDANAAPVYTDGYGIFDSRGAKQLECDEMVTGLTLASASPAGIK